MYQIQWVSLMLIIISLKRKNYHFEEGQKFVQGIFTIFGITINDDEDEKEDRNGGFGSTDKESVKPNDPISSDEDDDMTDAEPITDDDIASMLELD